jgi:Zn-dependent protease with chaperone function
MQKPINPSASVNPFILPPETDGRFLLLQLLAYVGTFAIASNLGRFLTSLIPMLAHTSNGPLRDTLGLLIGLAMVGVLWVWTRSRVARAAQAMIDALKLRPGSEIAKDSIELQAIADAEYQIRSIAKRIPELATQPDLVWRRDHDAEIYMNGMAFGGPARSLVCLFYSMSAAFRIQRSRHTFYTIVLHELAHLANHDVTKTVAARELFRNFRTLTATMVSLYFVITLINWLMQASAGGLKNIGTERTALLLSISFQLLSVYLLVQFAFRSILRVREYYADARAARWLGSQHDYHIPHNSVRLIAPPIRSAFATLLDWVARKSDLIAPTHPSDAQRDTALQQLDVLFRVSIELAILSGALTGLALNTGFQLVTHVSSLIDLARQMAPETPIPTLLSLLYVVVIVGVVHFICLIPLAESLGLQTQRATLADTTKAVPQRSIVRVLLLPALASGGGLVFGAAIAPTPNALSLWGSTLLMAPLYALGWAFLIVLWMFCIRWITQRLLRANGSAATFRQRAQRVRWMCALAAAPIFTMAALTQVISSMAITFPEMFAGFDPELVQLLPLLVIALWVLAGIGSAIICAICLVRAHKANWFIQGVCPSCNTPMRHAEVAYCAQCGTPLHVTSEIVPMITLPPPPTYSPSTPYQEAPPL